MMDIDAFIQAAEKGNIKELKRLISLSPAETENMLSAHYFKAFRLAAQNGHIDVMKYLVELAGDSVQKMVAACNFNACIAAAFHGHLDIMEYLAELAGDRVQEMVAADNFLAFRTAAFHGHLDVMEYLAELAGDRVQEMVAADNFSAFRIALAVVDRVYAGIRFWVSSREIAVMEYLMSFSSVFAYAEMHGREYGSDVQAFMHQRLGDLAQEMEAFQASHPNEVFDITDLEQAKLYFYMMRNLIRQGTPESLTQLNRLLSIPAVKALAHQEVTPHQSNELLRLAMSCNNHQAALLLINIPAVRNLAQENNFYQEQQRPGIDLRTIAQDQESSMRSLTQGEQQALQRALTEYEPQIRARGVSHIMDELKLSLARRYAANPALVQTEDGREIKLPLEYDAFEDITEELSADTRERALQSYYKHPDHSALRYLSKPNRWMSPDAGFVNRSEIGEWSTFEDYQDLITLMYLAAKDETNEAINGYTIETRLENFIQELALIGRAHNWDETRTNPSTGLLEAFDDLQGDKPSCFSGVKKRLFQSVQGHPLLALLTQEIIDQAVCEVIRDHFISCINDENCVALANAWEAIILGEEPDLSILAQFNFSQEKLDGHIASISAKLTDKYGSGFNLAFKAYLLAKFELRPPVNSLIEKFGLKTDLETILNDKKQELGAKRRSMEEKEHEQAQELVVQPHLKENKRNKLFSYFAAGTVVVGTGMVFSSHAQNVVEKLFSFMPHDAAIVKKIVIFAAAIALLAKFMETLASKEKATVSRSAQRP